MKKILILTMFLIGCGGSNSTSTVEAPLSCKGTYTETNENGLVDKRFEEYKYGDSCLTDNRPLTTYETTALKYYDDYSTCTPQPQFQSVTLISANNYYHIRNGSIYLDLDSSTGKFRRLIISKTQDGKYTTYTKQHGCFYEREDVETEFVNPTNYGKQILLDLELSASSRQFTPMEVFKYDIVNNDYNMQRFDDQEGVDWQWCPTLNTPVGYCDSRRNGNIYYEVDAPSAFIQLQLKNEALLLRNEFNFVKTTKLAFDTALENAQANYIEKGTPDIIEKDITSTYTPSHSPDVPRYVHRALRDYLMSNRLQMPDMSSPTAPQICYFGRKTVKLDDNSTSQIYGEICYVDGVYHFTQL